MRRPSALPRLVTSLALLAACSAPMLTPMGRGVVAMGTPPPGRCQPLGPVTGEGRGVYSTGSLIEYATNDARNQAAALGATHLHTTPPALTYSASAQSAGVSGATVTGTAYRCPVGSSDGEQAQRGVYAALGPTPAWPTQPANAASPPPLMVSESVVAEAPAPGEVALRAALDAHRREILTCVGREMAAVDAAYTLAGTVTLSLPGDLAGSAAEGCVRSAVGALHVDHPAEPGGLRHLVR